MKHTRHTPEQIIRKLRDADAELASGKAIPEVCKGSVPDSEPALRGSGAPLSPFQQPPWEGPAP